VKQRSLSVGDEFLNYRLRRGDVQIIMYDCISEKIKKIKKSIVVISQVP
jgi:hypothetical protein